MGVVSRKTERMDVLQIKSNEQFLGRHFVKPVFFLPNRFLSNTQATQNQPNTGTTCRVGKHLI